MPAEGRRGRVRESDLGESPLARSVVSRNQFALVDKFAGQFAAKVNQDDLRRLGRDAHRASRRRHRLDLQLFVTEPAAGLQGLGLVNARDHLSCFDEKHFAAILQRGDHFKGQQGLDVLADRTRWVDRSLKQQVEAHLAPFIGDNLAIANDEAVLLHPLDQTPLVKFAPSLQRQAAVNGRVLAERRQDTVAARNGLAHAKSPNLLEVPLRPQPLGF